MLLSVNITTESSPGDFCVQPELKTTRLEVRSDFFPSLFLSSPDLPAQVFLSLTLWLQSVNHCSGYKGDRGKSYHLSCKKLNVFSTINCSLLPDGQFPLFALQWLHWEAIPQRSCKDGMSFPNNSGASEQDTIALSAASTAAGIKDPRAY